MKEGTASRSRGQHQPARTKEHSKCKGPEAGGSQVHGDKLERPTELEGTLAWSRCRSPLLPASLSRLSVMGKGGDLSRYKIWQW